MKFTKVLAVMLAAAVILSATLSACSVGDAAFGMPNFGEIQSITVQEYANGVPVSREVTLDISKDAKSNGDNKSALILFGTLRGFTKTKEEGRADQTQALLYRVLTADQGEFSFYLYLDHEQSYFQKTDGEVWKDTGDLADVAFEGEYSNYRYTSIREAFDDHIADRSFRLPPGYNGTGKALFIEDTSSVSGEAPDAGPRIKPEQINWDGWDGTGGLELPLYNINGYREYEAVRTEDIRFIIFHTANRADLRGYWADSKGNHLSDDYTYGYVTELIDLETGESYLFEGTEDEMREQVKAQLDEIIREGDQ